MSFDNLPLNQPIQFRPGWRRTEGFDSFPIPIQPHFEDEFPLLSKREFILMIGFQLWWINGNSAVRKEMNARQTILGPSAWTAFAELKETPELIAGQIRSAMRNSRSKFPLLQFNHLCFEPTVKVQETSGTVADIISDIDASIPQLLSNEKTRIQFILEDRRNNPFAPADYRQDELNAIERRIKKLINKLNGHGGPNWFIPLNQQITQPEHFK